jgi:hypothetical protein
VRDVFAISDCLPGIVDAAQEECWRAIFIVSVDQHHGVSLFKALAFRMKLTLYTLLSSLILLVGAEFNDVVRRARRREAPRDLERCT